MFFIPTCISPEKFWQTEKGLCHLVWVLNFWKKNPRNWIKNNIWVKFHCKRGVHMKKVLMLRTKTAYTLLFQKNSCLHMVESIDEKLITRRVHAWFIWNFPTNTFGCKEQSYRVLLHTTENKKAAGQCSISAEKTALSAHFLDASRQKFWKSALANLDAISFTKEIFIKHNFVIFLKMCRTMFTIEAVPRSQHGYTTVSHEKSSDTVRKFSAFKFIKKFWVHFHNLCLQERSCFP